MGFFIPIKQQREFLPTLALVNLAKCQLGKVPKGKMKGDAKWLKLAIGTGRKQHST